jgi:hypothetical protein
MMEEADFSETLVHFYKSTWHCNPQHNYFHTDSHHILISHFQKLVAVPQNSVSITSTSWLMLCRERNSASCENHTGHNNCARHGVTMTEHAVGISFCEGNTDSCNLSDHHNTSSWPVQPCQVSGTAEVISPIVVK